MASEKCKSCSIHTECRDSAWSWIFLFVGIVAAVSMRVVAVFINVNPVYAKTAWYIGIGLFFFFFVYRYMVSRSKARMISEANLIQKMRDDKPLGVDDRRMAGEILCSISSNKERINFIVIFVLSFIALIIAVVADMAR